METPTRKWTDRVLNKDLRVLIVLGWETRPNNAILNIQWIQQINRDGPNIGFNFKI